MSDKIFQDFRIDLGENFKKEFKKIEKRNKLNKKIALILEEILIDNGKLDKQFSAYPNLWNKIDTNNLTIGFKLMLDNNKDKICCLKKNKDNE